MKLLKETSKKKIGFPELLSSSKSKSFSTKSQVSDNSDLMQVIKNHIETLETMENVKQEHISYFKNLLDSLLQMDIIIKNEGISTETFLQNLAAQYPLSKELLSFILSMELLDMDLLLEFCKYQSNFSELYTEILQDIDLISPSLTKEHIFIYFLQASTLNKHQFWMFFFSKEHVERFVSSLTMQQKFLWLMLGIFYQDFIFVSNWWVKIMENPVLDTKDAWKDFPLMLLKKYLHIPEEQQISFTSFLVSFFFILVSHSAIAEVVIFYYKYLLSPIFDIIDYKQTKMLFKELLAITYNTSIQKGNILYWIPILQEIGISKKELIDLLKEKVEV